MRKLFLLFGICCFSAWVKAQEILTPQAQARFVTSFPFKQYSGGVMILQATIDGVPDTLNFILDTGSGGISLDSTTCAVYGLEPRYSDTVVTGMGSAHKARFIYDRQLKLPGLTIDNLDFHVNDYEVLTSVYGEKIDGIIGYSFLRRYIVKINFDSLKIEVYRPGEIKYPRGGTLIRPVFTTLPIQNLTVKDRRKLNFNFYFDTGAGLCFLMSEKFAKDSAILLSKRNPVTTQAEGMGGRLEMKVTVVKMLQVGHYKFRNVPTYIFSDDYNVTSYPYVGGLLGNDLLRRFNMIINYPQREIHLLPNGHFNDMFDYAYTGMAMYFIDGRIMVEDVVKGSPADKAGIKVNDVVIAVGNNFTNNIMQYKTILQSANVKTKIIISRNDQLIELSIKPKSIF